jgi:hypothetical protein
MTRLSLGVASVPAERAYKSPRWVATAPGGGWTEPPRVFRRLWSTLGFTEVVGWIHAAVVGCRRASNSMGLIMPSDECRRWRLCQISRYSKIAVASSTRVFHRRVSSNSTCIRLQNDSIIALS